MILRPIKESTEDFELIERRMKEAFRRVVYYPILKDLVAPKRTIQNEDVNERLLTYALHDGRIRFSKGEFTGRFDASISKELKALGAQWDRHTRTWKIPKSSLPIDIKQAISLANARFDVVLARIDEKLAKILPEEISGRVKSADVFDRALTKVETDFQASVRGITIAPQITARQRSRISEEWQFNMDLWIQKFTEEEINKLRIDIQESAFAGKRYESAVKAISDSYNVTANKAKFLARQETSLLMTKYKQTRYEAAGVKEYIWGTVVGTKNHPVRPSHKKLEGKKFSWQNPPITTEPGEPARRNNPGQDYNCRCFARPIVKFGGRTSS